MVQIKFNNEEINRGKRVWPEYNLVAAKIEENLTKSITYRQSYKRHLDGNNFLIRLLHALPIDPALTINKQTMAIYDRGLEIASIHGCFSTLSSGDVKRQVLFGERCYEVFIATLGKGWQQQTNFKELTPIRCLRHPFQSLNFWVDELEAVELSDESAIFSIDLIDLALQYHGYLNYTKRPSVTDYITRYIVPSLMGDMANITLFNRLSALSHGLTPFVDPVRNPPVWMDVNEELDQQQEKMIKELEGSDGHINTIVGLTELRQGIFLNQLPQFPETFINHNLYGISLTSQLPLLKFLLHINTVAGRTSMADIKNKIKNEIQQLRTDKALFSEHRDLRRQQETDLKALENLL